MPVQVIDTLKPKNGLDFPVVEAEDVAVSDGLRLPEALGQKAEQSDLEELSSALTEKADQSDLDALETVVEGKADTSDVATATANLQAQIDEIITPVTQDAEVQNARVSADGTSYQTLKGRLDAENNALRTDLNIVGVHSSQFDMNAETGHSSSSDKIQMTVNSGDSIIISVFTNTTLSGSGRTYDVFGYPANSSTGTKIGTGTTNGSKIKITVDTAYSSFGVYVRALGVASKVTFLVENENSIVTRCAVVEKKEFGQLTPLILGHNQPYKVAFSIENKTMTIPKDTIAFVVSDLGVRSWLSITPDEASIISLDIGTSAISVYFDVASSEFSAKAYNSALSDEFTKNNILIADIRFSADGMILPSIACEYKIVEDVPLPFIYGYGVMIPPGAGGYPEINTTAQTVTIPNDILLLDNRLSQRYVSLPATILSYSSVSSGALVVYYDITNATVSIAGYSSRDFTSEDEIVLFTFRKSKKTVCGTIPIYVDGKLFGIVDTSSAAISSFVNGINHRGYCTVAPENTIPAYKLSKLHGFDTVETDVEWTSDGIPVLLHDSTIDRTSDGEGNVGDYTYEELLEFDFGSWKSEIYAGTKIPTFDEFIKLCRNLGLKAYIEIKDQQTQERIDLLIEIVKKYHMIDNVTWISSNRTSLARILSTQANARIGITQSIATDALIDDAISMKTNVNTVFIDVSTITDELIESCIENGISVEMWTVNSQTDMLSANSYISGFTSDSINAKEIFSNVTNN